MTRSVIVQSKVVAQNIDSLNRTAVAAADLENGNLVILATRNTSATRGQEEVWDATCPATATLAKCWMVYEPEVVTLISGTKSFKGIDSDPQDFYLPTGEFFSVFKPQVGDILLLTADAFSNSRTAEGFAVAADASYELAWNSVAISGLSLKYLSTEYISLGSGAIDSQRVTAYSMEVVAIA